MMPRSKWGFLALIFIAIGGGYVAWSLSRLERRDPQVIESYLLREIPQKSSKEQLIAFLRQSGYDYHDDRSSVEAELAEFFSPPLYITTVIAEWRVSTSNTVDLLEVRRYRDAP